MLTQKPKWIRRRTCYFSRPITICAERTIASATDPLTVTNISHPSRKASFPLPSSEISNKKVACFSSNTPSCTTGRTACPISSWRKESSSFVLPSMPKKVVIEQHRIYRCLMEGSMELNQCSKHHRRPIKIDYIQSELFSDV